MEDNFYKRIGELIRRERRMKEYSQEYMAAKLEISQNVYSQIESGKIRPSVYKLHLICKLLGIDLDDVMESMS